MTHGHANIPVFIPHLGCPNMCVFCDQKTISGTESFSEEKVDCEIREALATLGKRRAEIAFFGGSFTGIDRGLMIRLLDTAEKYVKSGDAAGIRMSTRPDYIDEEIIDILGRYTVTEVELGVQSMSDAVLCASKRGHTAETTERACGMLKEAGIPFVGQMMIGLPGADGESERECAERICRLGAVGCRIYPTVVFHGTELEKMTCAGKYTPLTVDEAAERSADVLEVFERHGVRVLRIGLCESDGLHAAEKYFAGPAHPAMGEIVRSVVFLRRMKDELEKNRPTEKSSLTVEVPRGCVSSAVGMKRKNKEILEKTYNIKIKFTENGELTGFSIRVHQTRREER